MTAQDLKHQRWNACKAHRIGEIRYPCICTRTPLEIVVAKLCEYMVKRLEDGKVSEEMKGVK